MHTTVIRAAGQCEIGNLVRDRAPKRPDAANFAEMFQQIYRRGGSGTRFFTTSLKRHAPTAVARLLVVEMVASETPERCRSTFLEKVCVSPRVSVDLIDFVFRGC